MPKFSNDRDVKSRSHEVIRSVSLTKSALDPSQLSAILSTAWFNRFEVRRFRDVNHSESLFVAEIQSLAELVIDW